MNRGLQKIPRNLAQETTLVRKLKLKFSTNGKETGLRSIDFGAMVVGSILLFAGIRKVYDAVREQSDDETGERSETHATCVGGGSATL